MTREEFDGLTNGDCVKRAETGEVFYINQVRCEGMYVVVPADPVLLEPLREIKKLSMLVFEEGLEKAQRKDERHGKRGVSHPLVG
jgi:hypothetical protein